MSKIGNKYLTNIIRIYNTYKYVNMHIVIYRVEGECKVKLKISIFLLFFLPKHIFVCHTDVLYPVKATNDTLVYNIVTTSTKYIPDTKTVARTLFCQKTYVNRFHRLPVIPLSSDSFHTQLLLNLKYNLDSRSLRLDVLLTKLQYIIFIYYFFSDTFIWL